MIVHADDFGLSEKVNEGILFAHSRGIVTSASLIANGEAFEQAVRMSYETPSLDVGIHLSLVEERPVMEAKLIPTLVNGEGRFHDHANEFMKRYLSKRINIREVQSELDAQVRKVISRGIKLSHLDSHQHLHMVPKIWQITAGLAQKYGIPAIRYTRERLRVGMLKEAKLLPRLLLLLLVNLSSRLSRDVGMIRTKEFVGFLYSGILDKKNLKKLLRHLPTHGTCELMCHPGLDDPDSHYGHWQYRWQDELEALTDGELPGLLEKMGITLISYRELAGCLDN
jgi:hopanoid biosynthesis associated protein HpnK